MANDNNTVEILLQIKSLGTEIIDAVNGKLQSMGVVGKGLSTALTGVGAIGSAAFRGIAAAADVAYSAIMGPLGLLYDAGKWLLGFLNPFSIKGLVTGALTGTVGVMTKHMLDAAGAIETYQNRLGGLLGDQAKANQVVGEMDTLAVKLGRDLGETAKAYESLVLMNVKNPDRAVQTVAGVAALQQIPMEEITSALQTLRTQTLRGLGIEMKNLGDQTQLSAAGVTVTTDNATQHVQQAILDLLDKVFPNAIDRAEGLLVVKMASLKEWFGQYLQAAGQALMPYAEQIIDWLTDFLRDHLEQFEVLVNSIPQMLAAVWEALKALLQSGQVATLLSGPIATGMQLVLDAVHNVLDILLASLQVTWEFVLLGFREMVAEMQAVWQAFAENLIPTLVNGALAAVTNAAPGLSQTVMDFTLRQAGVSQGQIDLMRRNGVDLTPQMQTKDLGQVAQGFEAQSNQNINAFVQAMPGRIGAVAQGFKSLFKDAAADGSQFWDALKAIDSQVTHLGDKLATIYGQTKATLDAAHPQGHIPYTTKTPAPIQETDQVRAEIQAALDPTAYSQQRNSIVQQYQGMNKQFSDLANTQQITPQSFDAVKAALAQKQQQALQELEDKWKFQVSQQEGAIEVSQLQAQHDNADAQVKQIELQRDKAIQALRDIKTQGLISAQDYAVGVQAIMTTAGEKTKAINGSVWDGMKLGARQFQDSLLTSAQFGVKFSTQLANDLSNGFTDAFTSMIQGTKSVAQAFKDMAASILNDIAKMMIQQSIAAPIAGFLTNALGGALGGMFGGMFGGAGAAATNGIGGGLLSFGGSAFAAAGGTIPGFAGGGQVTDSVPAMLAPGEEVIRPQVARYPGMRALLKRMNSGVGLQAAMRAARGIPALGGGYGAVGAGGGPGGAGGGLSVAIMVPSEQHAEAIFKGGKNALRMALQNDAPAIRQMLGVRQS